MTTFSKLLFCVTNLWRTHQVSTFRCHLRFEVIRLVTMDTDIVTMDVGIIKKCVGFPKISGSVTSLLLLLLFRFGEREGRVSSVLLHNFLLEILCVFAS